MLLALVSITLAGRAMATPPVSPGGVLTTRRMCGTPAFLPALVGRPRLPARALPPPSGEREERDAYGEFPNEIEGEHFVVKWGDSGGVDEAGVEALLAAFENAWSVEVEEMGYPAPAYSDAYYFNIYVGDTGSGTPDGYGTSGYYNTDSDGYPMIVVAAETLSDPTWARGTATHEFFHSLQDVTDRYDYTGESAWYWEATAMWMEGEVLDGYEDYMAFLYGYALLPELPVYFFDYPDTGALQEYHQYGAFIFPRYISEIAADWEVIRDSWVVDLDADTPQDAIATLLADRDIDFADTFGDYAAHNATWDYADGDRYAEWVDYYGDYYRADDHRIVADVDSDGTDGLVAAPDDTLPGRMAYNIVAVWRPGNDPLRVSFEGAAEGSRGSPADWRVTVVIDRDGGPEYVPVPLAGDAGDVLVPAAVDADAVYLVAAAVPVNARADETFAWSYGFVPEPAAEDDTASDLPRTPDVDGGDGKVAGCGCVSTGTPPGALFTAFAGMGLLAARRRTR
jgi:MYXO-CTERM domain-containing protein